MAGWQVGLVLGSVLNVFSFYGLIKLRFIAVKIKYYVIKMPKRRQSLAKSSVSDSFEWQEIRFKCANKSEHYVSKSPLTAGQKCMWHATATAPIYSAT